MDLVKWVLNDATTFDRARTIRTIYESATPIPGPVLDPNSERFLREVENDLNIPRAMAVVWTMLHAQEESPATRVRLLLDFDRILGFGLKDYIQIQPRPNGMRT